MIKEALDTYARSLKKEWAHDRTKTVGASEIGQCARKIAFSKQGQSSETPDAYGAKMRGDVIEGMFFVPALRARYGDNILYCGEDQKTFVDGFLSATPDGLLINQPKDFLKDLGVEDMGDTSVVTECKSIDPRVTLTEEKFIHNYQTIVQLGMIRAHTPYKPNYALITYIDASFFDQITEFAVPFDQETYDSAQYRAEKMLTAEPMNLHAEGYIGGEKECAYCPYTKACGVIRKQVPDVEEKILDEDLLDDLKAKCQLYRSLADTKDSTEFELRKLSEDIKSLLRKAGTKKVPGLVTYYATKGRIQYDTKGLIEEAKSKNIDITKYETIGEPGDRLLVK